MLQNHKIAIGLVGGVVLGAATVSLGSLEIVVSTQSAQKGYIQLAWVQCLF